MVRSVVSVRGSLFVCACSFWGEHKTGCCFFRMLVALLVNGSCIWCTAVVVVVKIHKIRFDFFLSLCLCVLVVVFNLFTIVCIIICFAVLLVSS